MTGAVIDTNIFVAAGFSRGSSSARILARVEAGDLRLVWNEATRAETKMIVSKIPRLDWQGFEPLFRPEDEYRGDAPSEAFAEVEDPEDRKFAALAAATGAVLVTNDQHLLTHRGNERFRVERPGAFLRNLG